jgi:phosphoenolpyruvate carboxykinase (ATP)
MIMRGQRSERPLVPPPASKQENQVANRVPTAGLATLGIDTPAALHWNLGSAALVEQAIVRGEGVLAKQGPLVVQTGKHTGRSAQDKFLVRDGETEDTIWWDNNKSMQPEHFQALKAGLSCRARTKQTLYVADLYGGSQPEHRVNVRVINELAWHNLFIRTLLVRPERAIWKALRPTSRSSTCRASARPRAPRLPQRDGDRRQPDREADPDRRHRLCRRDEEVGVRRAQYMLPAKGVMPMHCSANVGGTGAPRSSSACPAPGKTTLSADPARTLIGDDEHGWSDTAVFNFEGGCYAKMIRLSAEAEPEIYATTKRFGTVLENVVIDPDTRELDLDDPSLARTAAAPIRSTSSRTARTPIWARCRATS